MQFHPDIKPAESAAPFSIVDIARAAAKNLSGRWAVVPGAWSVNAEIVGGERSFHLGVDEEGDLYLHYRPRPDDRLPDVMPRGVVVYPDGLFFEGAYAEEGLMTLSARVAAAIEAVTGNPAPVIQIPAPGTAIELGRAHAEFGRTLVYPTAKPLTCHSTEHPTPAAAGYMVSHLGFTVPTCGDHKDAAADVARELYDLS
ncbi:hypothetical protein ACFWMT_20310 [Streptomyces sp. NPDC058368]|uniref:hypothetical protein n=1 Tax=Streptomyces sp. NPDC058368 TaxID=3346461 RepID=UPI00364F51E5